MGDNRVEAEDRHWWRHNRGMTLVHTVKDENVVKAAGIYMRRWLQTSLVAPVRVDGEDCEFLERLFSHYVAKQGTQEIPI